MKQILYIYIYIYILYIYIYIIIINIIASAIYVQETKIIYIS